MSQDVSAIRAVLEAFSLRVHLYDLVQKRNALEVLAGDLPGAEYVILCCHGSGTLDGVPRLRLEVIDQADGDYDQAGGWEQAEIELTPANIPDHFRGQGRTLICIGCGSGQEAFAQAFLRAGFRAYIAPRGSGTHTNATLLFIAGFFYHLLAATRVYDEPLPHTDQEAVLLAAQADPEYTRGTRTYHFYSEA